ncbi:MAG: YkgJ family cysteine cluster protein [Candidatus Thorarchaeota archaeon]
MNKSITRQIYEDVESGKNKKLELTDEFKFQCKRCGQCCHNIDILLTPYDIMRLCDNLNLTSTEFLDKFGRPYIGPESGLPVVIIDFKEDDACPFLGQNECSVYKDRPSSCRSYPIGRMIDSENNAIYFLMPSPKHCTAQRTVKSQTLQDWLEKSEIEIYHKMNNRFAEILFKLTKNKFADLDNKILWVVSEVLYDFDHSLSKYAEVHNLSVPETHEDKFSMIEKSMKELIEFVSKEKSKLEELMSRKEEK